MLYIYCSENVQKIRRKQTLYSTHIFNTRCDFLRQLKRDRVSQDFYGMNEFPINFARVFVCVCHQLQGWQFCSGSNGKTIRHNQHFCAKINVLALLFVLLVNQ